MRSFETTLVVDGQGRTRVDQPLALTPGRHRAVVMIDDEALTPTESWGAFIERTFGSIAESTLERHPQGEYEQREAIE